ncbi:MAG: hypothetical protein KDK27_18455, partial [Leptospiraceae bacterium]|nr:hypothetical protein [Leptospiraceae bacterium]
MHLDQLRTRLRRIRSSILIPIVIIAALPPLYFTLLNRVGGAYHFSREASYLSLSRGAVDLIQAAFADVDSDRLVDFHVHVVGLGTHCAGCSIHPDFYSNLHPLKRMRFRVYAGA